MKILGLCMLVLLALAGGIARADDGAPVFSEAWVRAAPPGAAMLAGYLRIAAPAGSGLDIVEASSPDFGAVEFHRTETVDGVSRMREVDALEVPAGGTLVLEPGGLHLMLMQPTRALAEGEAVRIDFTDRDGRVHEVAFPVRRAAAAGHDHHHH